jgi:hypothetical protein
MQLSAAPALLLSRRTDQGLAAASDASVAGHWRTRHTGLSSVWLRRPSVGCRSGWTRSWSGAPPLGGPWQRQPARGTLARAFEERGAEGTQGSLRNTAHYLQGSAAAEEGGAAADPAQTERPVAAEGSRQPEQSTREHDEDGSAGAQSAAHGEGGGAGSEKPKHATASPAGGVASAPEGPARGPLDGVAARLAEVGDMVNGAAAGLWAWLDTW